MKFELTTELILENVSLKRGRYSDCLGNPIMNNIYINIDALIDAGIDELVDDLDSDCRNGEYVDKLDIRDQVIRKLVELGWAVDIGRYSLTVAGRNSLRM